MTENDLIKIQYKGHTIQPSPYRLADTGKWTVRVDFWLNESDRWHNRNFTPENSFGTMKEAEAYGIKCCKQRIDDSLRR